MKKRSIRIFIAICFLVILLSGFLALNMKWEKDLVPKKTVVSQAPSEDEDDELIDPDLKWQKSPVFIDDIDVKTITTTAKLHEVFDGFLLYSIPTVFIEKIPTDFPKEGDAKLFIKAVLPLVMRENQQITDDRKFLLSLDKKMKAGQEWTPDETVRFEGLTRTYDTFRKKMVENQIVELLDKVDVIPNSLVIAQMGVQTDWGRVNLDSPLGQKEWVNGQYVYKKFDTLPKAVKAYMQEVNGMQQYQNMRVQRRVYRKLRGSLSMRLIDYLTPFAPDDPTLVYRLKDAYKQFNLGALDNAMFWQ